MARTPVLIAGLGHDLQEIDGLADKSALLEPDLVFTRDEVARIRRAPCPARTLAGHFSAKEAFFKSAPALGAWYWNELELCSGDGGKPYFRYHGALRARMAALRLSSEVSISHSGAYASSVVLMAEEEGGDV